MFVNYCWHRLSEAERADVVTATLRFARWVAQAGRVSRQAPMIYAVAWLLSADFSFVRVFEPQLFDETVLHAALFFHDADMPDQAHQLLWRLLEVQESADDGDTFKTALTMCGLLIQLEWPGSAQNCAKDCSSPFSRRTASRPRMLPSFWNQVARSDWRSGGRPRASNMREPRWRPHCRPPSRRTSSPSIPTDSYRTLGRFEVAVGDPERGLSYLRHALVTVAGDSRFDAWVAEYRADTATFLRRQGVPAPEWLQAQSIGSEPRFDSANKDSVPLLISRMALAESESARSGRLRCGAGVVAWGTRVLL